LLAQPPTNPLRIYHSADRNPFLIKRIDSEVAPFLLLFSWDHHRSIHEKVRPLKLAPYHRTCVFIKLFVKPFDQLNKYLVHGHCIILYHNKASNSILENSAPVRLMNLKCTYLDSEHFLTTWFQNTFLQFTKSNKNCLCGTLPIVAEPRMIYLKHF
jgi:hypothetical protein